MEHLPQPGTNGSLFSGRRILVSALRPWNPSALCSSAAFFPPPTPQGLISPNAEIPLALWLFLALTLELCKR